MKYFNIHTTFFWFETISIIISKNKNKAKKSETNFHLAADSFIKKYQTISIKDKIGISQLIAKIEHKQQSLNQSDIVWKDTFKSDINFLLHWEILKYFNDFQNQKISVLRLKWTQTIEMKQNQSFFHGSSSKSYIIFHWLQKN